MVKETLKDLIPAIPPEDYKGSVGRWISELQIRVKWKMRMLTSLFLTQSGILTI